MSEDERDLTMNPLRGNRPPLNFDITPLCNQHKRHSPTVAKFIYLCIVVPNVFYRRSYILEDKEDLLYNLQGLVSLFAFLHCHTQGVCVRVHFYFLHVPLNIFSLLSITKKQCLRS